MAFDLYLQRARPFHHSYPAQLRRKDISIGFLLPSPLNDLSYGFVQYILVSDVKFAHFRYLLSDGFVDLCRTISRGLFNPFHRLNFRLPL